MAAQTITKVPYVDNETVIGASNLNAIQDAINDHASQIDGLDSNKVDKVVGKGLSTNDFNNDAQSKLNNLPSGPELDTSLGQKVDKRTSGTEVYTHNGSTQGGATLTETPTAGAVPQYGTDGVLKAGAPVAANDVVRKAELDEVVDEMSDSTTGLGSKAPAIIETVGPAAIASFDDGADSMPVKKLVANIEPVQDLHGYDSPWPAGGGKNKFNPNSTSHEWVNGSNQITTLGSAITNRIPVTEGTTVWLSQANAASTSNVYMIAILDENDIVLARATYASGQTALSRTVPTGGTVAIAGFYDASLVSNPQFEVGSSATSFTPYENICPISGWTGAEITGCGKNLFNKSRVTQNKYVTLDGTEYAIAGFFISDYIPVNAGDTYYCNHIVGSGSLAVSIAYYDINKNFISSAVSSPGGSGAVGGKEAEFLIPQGVHYIRFNGVLSVIDQTTFNASGDNNSFASYTGSQISVTFPSEAGTVYGGTLTINPDRTGTLVVDKAFTALDGTDMSSISLVGTNTSGKSRIQILANRFPDVKGPSASTVKSECLSNLFGTVTAAETYSCIDGIAVVPSGNVFIYADSVQSLNDFQALISTNPLQIVYPIATPITYTLTASEISAILTTLYGTNNIWSSTGDTEVTYPADTKLYVDSAITEAIAAALNA